MKLMAITRRLPDATTERIQALQLSEVTMVWSMILAGFIREIYFDPKRPCVVLIIESENEEKAAARLDELPMVKARQIGFDYYALGPYRQLENLFSGG
jgi:hypothetical protein